MLITQADKYLLTEIRINKNDIHLSLFKNFPYISLDLYNILLKSAPGVRFKDFNVAGPDTLIFAERISLNFNIRSLLAKKYDLKKIEVEGAKINILTDKNGANNYSIIKETTPDSLAKDSVNFDLKKVTVKRTKFSYQDAKSGVLFSDFIEAAEMTGSFKKEDFLVNLLLSADDNSFEVLGNYYLEHEKMSVNLAIEKREKAYFIRKSEIALFGVSLNIDGKYSTKTNDYSMAFSCKAVPLQRTKATLIRFWSDFLLLSPQNGDLNMRGSIIGKGDSNPAISIQFEIKNGVFRNTDKNVRISDLYLKGSYTNGIKRNQLSSFLKIDSLSAQSGKSILFLTGSVQNFISPTFQGRVRGYIELQKLLVIESLSDKFDLSGIAKGNIQAKGTLPSLKNISNMDLQRIKLQGVIQLEEANIKTLTNAIPASIISGTVKVVNLMEVNLDEVIIKVGRSDLQIEGDITNLPYFVTDKSVYPIYRCNVKSNEFHAEDFMPGASNSQNGPFKIEFPDSVRIYADISIKSFEFGKFKSSDVSGIFSYNPKTIFVKNFKMRTQGGTISSDMRIEQSDGLIITENDATLQHVDMSELLYAFNEFGQTVITHEYIDGYLSATLYAKATWDLFLNPVYKHLALTSQATIDNGELINYEPMLGLSDFIAVEELKHIKFDRLQTSVVVDHEKVIIGQMKIKSSAITVTGSGEHNFDNSYTYRFQVGLSDILWKKAKRKKFQNNEFGIVADDGLGRHIIPLAITGKDTVFEVEYDKRTAGNILHDKILMEKQTWKDLTESDSQWKDSVNSNTIDWEDETTEPVEIKNEQTDQKSDPFKVEWEDE
jgi:hypothetical protein